MEINNDSMSYWWNKKNMHSLIFFIVSVLITLILVLYNYSLNRDIAAIDSEIKVKEMSITEINKDKNIWFYNLYSSNKKIFEKLSKQSDLNTYINHIDGIKEKYNIKFNSFNYSKWALDLSAIVEWSSESFAYNLVNDFIIWYRSDENSLFDLWFIQSFSGNDNIKFNVNFTLKK